MGRTIRISWPESASLDLAKPSRDAWKFGVRLVTPLFGGGPRAGQYDAVTPFAPKAIRGQLRYWWRLVAGWALPSDPERSAVELMSLRETEIFGSAELPSSFDLMVSDVRLAGERRLNERGGYDFEKFGPEAYALFSAKQNNVGAIVREGATFTLEVRWPSAQAFARRQGVERKRRDELEKARSRSKVPPLDCLDQKAVEDHLRAALWAWLNLGGLGARTRRGLGSVTTENPESSLLRDGKPRHVLPAEFILGDPRTGARAAMEAWAAAVGVYRDFRQGFRRPPGKKGPAPGRSKWPEPDSLRRISGCALKPRPGDPRDHSAPVVPEETIPGFPRAALGLPIIFHFAPGDGPDKNLPPKAFKDPADGTLNPKVRGPDGKLETGERMASPVLTRALCVEGRWRPAIIVLRPPAALAGLLPSLEATLDIKGVDAKGRTEDKQLAVSADRIVNSAFEKLEPMQGQSNALDALLAFARMKGFQDFKGK